MTPLNETEQKLVGLALFGYVMRAGPEQFTNVIAIADKIGVTDVLQEYAKGWTKSATRQPNALHITQIKAKATVQFAILHGITVQWHMKNHPQFPQILRKSIYNELIDMSYCKQALLELLTPDKNTTNENI